MTCNNFTAIVYRLDCEKVRKGLGNTARDLANSLLQNIVDTYRKENERYIIHRFILFLSKNYVFEISYSENITLLKI